MAETPEGFLLCLGVPIARTGEMDYGPGESPVEVGPDGRARISRDSKEVFRPETIASFEGKPFTISHPKEFVNPENWKSLACGIIQNVRRGTGEFANDLLADILVTVAEAIRLIKSGMREVSCGYEAEYVQLGIGLGMQTNILGNHLALVEQGRAGAAYAINDQKGAKMAKISERIKGIFAKAADEATKVVDDAAEGDKTKKTDDEMPKWGRDLQKQMKLVTDAMMSAMPAMAAGDKEEEEEEKKKADDAEGEEKKKSEDEAPAWAQDMAKCMNAIMEKLEGKSKDADEEEESEDADKDDEDAKDDDFEQTTAADTGDTAARIEILAPGMKFKGKDAMKQALEHAYTAKDHKMLIEGLHGGKTVDFKKMTAKTVDHLFYAASEVIKIARTKDFSRARTGVRDSASMIQGSETVSAEKLNEINAKFYAQKEGVH